MWQPSDTVDLWGNRELEKLKTHCTTLLLHNMLYSIKGFWLSCFHQGGARGCFQFTYINQSWSHDYWIINKAWWAGEEFCIVALMDWVLHWSAPWWSQNKEAIDFSTKPFSLGHNWGRDITQNLRSSSSCFNISQCVSVKHACNGIRAFIPLPALPQELLWPLTSHVEERPHWGVI